MTTILALVDAVQAAMPPGEEDLIHIDVMNGQVLIATGCRLGEDGMTLIPLPRLEDF